MSDSELRPPEESRTAVPVVDGPRRRVSGGGVTAGVILVILGLALALGQFVPYLNIVTAWPLIVIALGVLQAVRSRDLHGWLDGGTTVLLGGILLANTTGGLPWGVWFSIFSLWPLLLVSAGLAIIGRAVDQTWLRVLGHLVIIGGIVYGAFVMPTGTWRLPIVTSLPLAAGPLATFDESVPADSAVTRGTASVEWGAARITVRSGSELATVKGTAPAGLAPKLTSDVSGDRVNVRATITGGGQVVGNDSRLDVTLGKDITWERVSLQVGATQSDLDLSDLDVENVQVNTGASETIVKVGERARRLKVDVQAGAASVVLRVPKDAGVTVKCQGPIATTLPGGFTQTRGNLFDQSWEKRADDGPDISVSVSGGIMSLRLETY